MNSPKASNRLNDLDSRTWLQFQKSWFRYDHTAPAQFIEFFTKAEYDDGHHGTVCLHPAEQRKALPGALAQSRRCIDAGDLTDETHLDYAFVNLAEATDSIPRAETLEEILRIALRLRDRAYLTVVLQNQRHDGQTVPIAWEVARYLGRHLQLKDEKIGCLPPAASARPPQESAWVPDNSILYFMNFRKEKMLEGPSVSSRQDSPSNQLHNRSSKDTSSMTVGPDSSPPRGSQAFREAWFVHKPPPRPKGLILHPAKFPEDLVQKFVDNFTAPGDWVFDPMAGTGSTLVAAAAINRRACGIELNPQFAEIARSRFLLFDEIRLVQGDASDPSAYAKLPDRIDYCITSPPYWDMLRMKGAETQAKRKASGLPRWYSDDPRDLGNIEDYEQFLALLEAVYRQVAQHLRPGAYMTIIVKNVKKKGVIYPLAWDIVERLQPHLEFAGEQMWCQDDQRLAPFGYRYAWVSNTFHHYCLTFRKTELRSQKLEEVRS